MRVVKAFGTQDLERELARSEPGDGDAALQGAAVKALLSPIVTIDGRDLHRLCALARLGLDSGRGDDGRVALTVFLAYLAKFFKPVQDLAKMTNTIAQTAVGVERIQRDPGHRRRDSGAARRARTTSARGRDRFRPRRFRLRLRSPRAART